MSKNIKINIALVFGFVFAMILINATIYFG